MRNGPTVSMICRQCRIGGAQMRNGLARLEAVAGHGRRSNSGPAPTAAAPSISSMRRLVDDAAIGREAAHLAVGAQHAVAGHDDGDGIAAERLADLARLVRHAQPLGDLAIGQVWPGGMVRATS